MPNKKKVAASYLREIVGPKEPGKLYRKQEKQRKKHRKFQSKNMRNIG